MKEDIILLIDNGTGCYSSNPETRARCTTGRLITAGARYRYYPESKDGKYPAHYYCGTHIIYERDINWNVYTIASKYEELMIRLNKQIANS